LQERVHFLEKWMKDQTAIFKSNCKQIALLMRQCQLKRITCTFSGYGDSGGDFEVRYDEVKEVIGPVAMENEDGSITQHESIDAAVIELTETAISTNHFEGYELNDGGGGHLDFDDFGRRVKFGSWYMSPVENPEVVMANFEPIAVEVTYTYRGSSETTPLAGVIALGRHNSRTLKRLKSIGIHSDDEVLFYCDGGWSEFQKLKMANGDFQDFVLHTINEVYE
jgi:hypothetical protein